ncbi:MAG: mechanosensitive ion channel [Chlamydiia bacterium]|nr:mechanosensitive ion channel [Chlamydiia bacterium]
MNLSHIMDVVLFTIQDTPVTLVNLLTFLGVIVLSFLIAKGIERSMRVRRPALYGVGRLSYYIVFLVGFYIALTTIGIDLTGVAVVVGALGVGIGFGLQAIFNNFVAGVILLLEKKVSLGDFIETQSGDRGKILEINVRTTVLETAEGQRIVIPNTEMITKKVVIGGRLSRVVLPFSVSREVGKKQVQDITMHASLGEKSKLYLAKLSDTTAEYELVVWDSQKTARATYFWDLEEQFSKANIKISFA